jgi:hypothetical protein
MWEVFRYNVDSDVGEKVLEGTYWNEDEFGEHTKDILQEVAPTQSVIPKDLVSDTMQHGEWGQFWARLCKETSSSESGLHFSHDIAGVQSRVISHFHATKALVALKSGLGLEQWSRGMLVILEKILGCRLFSKL